MKMRPLDVCKGAISAVGWLDQWPLKHPEGAWVGRRLLSPLRFQMASFMFPRKGCDIRGSWIVGHLKLFVLLTEVLHFVTSAICPHLSSGGWHLQALQPAKLSHSDQTDLLSESGLGTGQVAGLHWGYQETRCQEHWWSMQGWCLCVRHVSWRSSLGPGGKFLGGFQAERDVHSDAGHNMQSRHLIWSWSII